MKMSFKSRIIIFNWSDAGKLALIYLKRGIRDAAKQFLAHFLEQMSESWAKQNRGKGNKRKEGRNARKNSIVVKFVNKIKFNKIKFVIYKTKIKD